MPESIWAEPLLVEPLGERAWLKDVARRYEAGV